jgi:hypothetical protein
VRDHDRYGVTRDGIDTNASEEYARSTGGAPRPASAGSPAAIGDADLYQQLYVAPALAAHPAGVEVYVDDQPKNPGAANNTLQSGYLDLSSRLPDLQMHFLQHAWAAINRGQSAPASYLRPFSAVAIGTRPTDGVTEIHIGLYANGTTPTDQLLRDDSFSLSVQLAGWLVGNFKETGYEDYWQIVQARYFDEPNLPLPILVTLQPTDPASMRSDSSSVLQGIVRDALTQAPVANAILRATDESQPLVPPVDTVTDGEGAYTLSISSAQPGDRIVVDVSSPSFLGSNPAQKIAIWLDWPAGSANRDFVLPAFQITNSTVTGTSIASSGRYVQMCSTTILAKGFNERTPLMLTLASSTPPILWPWGSVATSSIGSSSQTFMLPCPPADSYLVIARTQQEGEVVAEATASKEWNIPDLTPALAIQITGAGAYPIDADEVSAALDATSTILAGAGCATPLIVLVPVAATGAGIPAAEYLALMNLTMNPLCIDLYQKALTTVPGIEPAGLVGIQ